MSNIELEIHKAVDLVESPKLEVDDLDKVIQILQTPPEDRKLSKMLVLHKATADIQFFINLQEEMPEAHIGLCQYLGYENRQPLEYVFQAGESGTRFYIILEGKVSVVLKTKYHDEETSSVIEVENVVSILETGASFGELALVKQQPRAASIRCLTECHLATLDKKDYMTILGNITLKKIDALTAFLQNLPVFKSCTNKVVTRLSYYFKPGKYIRNQLVYKQGDPSDYVYIVKSGEFKLEREVPIKHEKQIAIDKYGRHKQETNKERQAATIKAEIAIIGEGEVIGDSDVMRGTHRTHHCKCYSRNAEVLAISKTDFLKRVNNPDSIAYLNMKNEILNYEHTERILKLERIKESGYSPDPKTSPSRAREGNHRQILESLTPIKLYHRPTDREKLKQRLLRMERPIISPVKKTVTDSHKAFNSELYEKRIQKMTDKLANIKSEFHSPRPESSNRSKSVMKLPLIKISQKLEEEPLIKISQKFEEEPIRITRYQVIEDSPSFMETGTFKVYSSRYEKEPVRKAKSDKRIKRRIV